MGLLSAHVHPPRACSCGNGSGATPWGSATRATLAVARIGYLVPGADFDGTVHSAFAQACNIACGELLLTLVVPGVADGPTTLVLDGNTRRDLRTLFRSGDRVSRRGGYAKSRCAVLYLGHATLWRPPSRRPILPDALIAANLRLTSARLAQYRHRHTSVIDHEGSAAVAALTAACAEISGEKASRQAQSLIGWGEGLTPAADDFLVGLSATLNALVGGDARRRAFLTDLGAAIAASAWRTTPIAAHYLRLAAQGHFTADLIDVRDALLSEQRRERLVAAIERALAVGASSGADFVAGILAGFCAWYRPQSAT